jgi:hypothetical protein
VATLVIVVLAFLVTVDTPVQGFLVTVGIQVRVDTLDILATLDKAVYRVTQGTRALADFLEAELVVTAEPLESPDIRAIAVEVVTLAILDLA